MAVPGTLPRARPRSRLSPLRVSYWICIAFELMALVPMLSPPLFGKIMAIPDFNPGSDYIYAMGIAAVFTLAWVLLLIWAERKPVERRGVALLTIVPVFAGNIVCGIYAAASAFIATAMMIPSWIAQLIIIVLLAFSYRQATNIDRAKNQPTR